MGQPCTITLRQKDRDAEDFTTFLISTDSQNMNQTFDFNEKNYIVLISSKKDIEIENFTNLNFKTEFMFLGWLVPPTKGVDDPILIKT